MKNSHLSLGLLVLVCSAVVLILMNEPVWSQAVRVKGVSTFHYESRVFSNDPDAEDMKKALAKAKESAWDTYTSRFNAGRMKQYLQIKDEFQKNINLYITEIRLVNQSVDEDAKKVTTIIRAIINESAVNALFSKFSASGSQATGEGSPFVFLFVARRAASVKSFDDKRVKITKSELSRSDKERLSANDTTAESSTTNESFSNTASGGSTVKKSAQISYSVSSSQDIDAAMGDVLTSAGFEVISYDDIVSECGGTERKLITNEFKRNDDMSRRSRRAAIKGSRECDVRFFATGTLDMGIRDTDPVTGNKRVVVSVRAQVWNITRRLPRKVASVGPVQFSGLGPDETVAQRNALILAAKNAGQTLVDQMNSKNIR
jgi:hypothetical protein